METAKIQRLRLSWEPASGNDVPDGDALASRLGSALDRWRGTPWAPGICVPQQGTDCIRFVGSVYDAMDRMDRAREVARLPQDLALRDRGMAIKAMLEFTRLYRPIIRITNRIVQPGDMLVTSTEPGAGPGHAIIVGPGRNTLWEAAGGQARGRVRMTGWSIMDGCRVFRVYRRSDRRGWC